MESTRQELEDAQDQDLQAQKAEAGQIYADHSYVDQIVQAMCAQDRYINLEQSILKKCVHGCSAQKVESFIRAYIKQNPSYHQPFEFIEALVNVHALRVMPINEQGQTYEISADDEQDPADYLLTTTSDGCRAAELLAPHRRLALTISKDSQRKQTFLSILRFCTQPRTLDDVTTYFKGHAEFARQTPIDHQNLSPDFYLSELEKAGGLVWRDGWVITQAGKEYLESEDALN